MRPVQDSLRYAYSINGVHRLPSTFPTRRRKKGGTLATESRSTPHHNSDLRDPVAASELLGVTRGTLAGWRCTKRYDLPFVKIGRVIRYRESDLQNFLEQHTVRQAPGATDDRP